MRLFKRRSDDPSPELVSATPISQDSTTDETKFDTDIEDGGSPTSSQEESMPAPAPPDSTSSFSTRKGN